MAEVYIDGELVVFEGEPPATLGDLNGLLVQALGQNGRVIDSMVVDEDPTIEPVAEASLSKTKRVDVSSITQGEAQDLVRDATVARLGESLAGVSAVAAGVLREPWTEVVGDCIEAVSKLGEVLENAGALVGVAGVEPAANQAMEAIGEWVGAIEKADAAGIALTAETEVVPALRELTSVLKGDGNPLR